MAETTPKTTTATPAEPEAEVSQFVTRSSNPKFDWILGLVL